ncbi:MAG TPA: hypothetical protein VIU11_27595 [Nakamurella sp.]
MSHGRATARPITVRAGLVAVAAVALASCASVGGTPATPSTSIATTSKASSPSAAPSSSAATSSTATSSSASPTAGSPTTKTPAPIAGVPRSAPLTDAQMIVTRDEDGQHDLYVIDATTGMVGAKLTKDAPGSQWPTMSPDRSTILYGQTSEHGVELRMMAADGTGDRPLVTVDSEFCENPQRPAWNPVDTAEIAVSCRSGEQDKLALISVDGTLRSTINTGFPAFDDPTYSPDGKLLAYWASTTPEEHSGAIYVQPVNGSEAPKQVTTPGARANDVDPVWSPDGKYLYFRRATEDASGGSTAQLLRVNADGSGLTPITDGTAFDNDPTVSPDGAQLAFYSNRVNAAGNNDGQIWVINVDGTGLRQVGIGKPGHASGPPEWSRR